jgi:pimeloyl-ACP methyl ester carboxylesterase
MRFRSCIVAALMSFTTLAPAALAAEDAPVFEVRVSGKGRPVLLIPGLASAGSVWDDGVARHDSLWQSHVVTLGGFAGAPRFEGPFLETARDALITYIRSARLEKPVLIGHSLGGVLALQIAIAAPDLAGPLVIMDALPFLGGAGSPEATAESARAAMAPMCDMLRGQSQEQYEAFQKTSPFVRAMVTRPADVERVTAWGVASDRFAVADAMLDVNATDLRPGLAAIESPALVIGTWFGMKAFTTRTAVDSTFRAQFAGLPGARFALADSARHFVMLDDPEWTWREVDAFLDERLSAKGGAR